MTNRLSLFACAVFVLSLSASALELPAIFSDHMVLQRGISVPVWGTAEPVQEVTVKLAGMEVQAIADEKGDWRVDLPAMVASFKPVVLTVEAGGSSGEAKKRFEDILVGEVWHCSGQSNMGWVVSNSANAKEEIAAADHPEIRLFRVPERALPEPDEMGEGQWKLCSPDTIGPFSAVAYYFGRKLQQDLDVPVGLVLTSWGGTPAEAFASRASLEAQPQLQDYVQRYDKDLDVLAEKRAGSPGWEELPTNHQDPGPDDTERLAAPDLDDRDWAQQSMPSGYSQNIFRRSDGVFWVRRKVTIPESWIGQSLELRLARIRQTDIAFVNGHEVGRTAGENPHYVQRNYTVPAEQVDTTELTIAVRIFDPGGLGGVFGSPAAMYIQPKGNAEERISLAGPWRLLNHVAMSPDAIRSGFELSWGPNHRPAHLFNAMIHPVAPFAHRGVIWYQGESNLGRHESYDTLMKKVIEDWRTLWDQPGEARETPFLAVQLANYTSPPAQPGESSWASLRDMQHTTAKTHPNTYLATAIDIGDAADIHPRNKQEVGRRLALIAERRVYGDESVVDQGPTFTVAEAAGESSPRTMRIHFDHAEGLATSNGETPRGFAVQVEADGKWVWAESAEIEGHSVLVHAPEGIEAPFAVRYGWANNPTDGPRGINLVNAAGLPAFPFQALQ
ncbi:sialate O-acetylesterase [Algisphaera agarilytica]|uniref:Sialate O-acetylesterase n=1 Tax=Algisphaera agarilytica TaxID=1385975 RepID=A0A7X0HA75_9BACT|nr:sialate O-acetylesterase [Algisphaera agarilytica]MBB6430644.1 sialate O-acetylesterase [Algisphaera agarilytica]